MKRLFIALASACALIAASPALSALAAEGGAPPEKNVTITVVVPGPAAEPETAAAPEPAPAPAASGVYPAGVEDIRSGEGWAIVKTYELAANENPAGIPREDFERQGWRFRLADIVRKETANAETKEHTETVTLNTDTKELDKIIPMLSQSMEFGTEDGFAGILGLDVASIRVETAGTKTARYTLSVTREYPHLSASDTELVPKTVTDKGRTYSLAGVEWKAGNYTTVDYERIADYYTAIATYTAAGSSTKATGYVTTAAYSGTLARLAQGKTVYTARFEGEEIRTPLEFAPPEAAEPREAADESDQSDESDESESEAAPADEPGGGTAETAETAETGQAGNPAQGDEPGGSTAETGQTGSPDAAPGGEPGDETAAGQTGRPAAASGGEQEEGKTSAPTGWMIATAALAAGCGAMYCLYRKARKEIK